MAASASCTRIQLIEAALLYQSWALFNLPFIEQCSRDDVLEHIPSSSTLQEPGLTASEAQDILSVNRNRHKGKHNRSHPPAVGPLCLPTERKYGAGLSTLQRTL